MSDKPISVGDLVMVVRGHSCHMSQWGGVPFRVEGFVSPTGGGWTCGLCKARDVATNERAALGLPGSYVSGIDARRAMPLSWLRRIPPLSELEGQRTQEDMREPA